MRPRNVSISDFLAKFSRIARREKRQRATIPYKNCARTNKRFLAGRVHFAFAHGINYLRRCRPKRTHNRRFSGAFRESGVRNMFGREWKIRWLHVFVCELVMVANKSWCQHRMRPVSCQSALINCTFCKLR